MHNGGVRVIYAVVCDHAFSGDNGKVSLIGIFSAAGAPAFPAMLPPFAVAFQIEPEDPAEGVRLQKTQCVFISPGGKELLHLDATGTPVKKTEIPGKAISNILFTFIGLVAETPGDYIFELRTDGKPVASASIHMYTTEAK